MRGTTWLTLSLLLLMLCMAGGAWAQEYWVDASAGSDANPGTEQLPFSTITHAVTTAGENATIQAMPGTYDADHGERFPIFLAAGQRLVGSPATKGSSPWETRISGAGRYDSPAIGGPTRVAVICASFSEISGFEFVDDRAGEMSSTAVLGFRGGVDINANTFVAHTSGVRMSGVDVGFIRNNVFETRTFGVSAGGPTREWTGPGTVCPIVANNLFREPRRPIYVSGLVHVADNTFAAGSETCVLVTGGSPRIENNLFETGSGTYEAIGVLYWADDNPGPMPTPIVRSNVFRSHKGIVNYGNPNLGTSEDPGLNDFTGVEETSLSHAGTADIWAIGNTWPNDPPIMGEDIIVSGGGSVILGPVPTQSTSVSRLKASFD